MKIEIILIIGLMILISGCTQYSKGTFQVHPCESPYSYNISCEFAKACFRTFDTEKYYEDKCTTDETTTGK